MPDCKGKTLQEVIRGRISLDKVIHSDGWRGYHGLVERGYKKHFRVNHLENQSSNSLSHINCIESFWSYVKTCLMNCSDMNPATFYLYLKETELRFKHRNKNMYNLMRKISKLKSLF